MRTRRSLIFGGMASFAVGATGIGAVLPPGKACSAAPVGTRGNIARKRGHVVAGRNVQTASRPQLSGNMAAGEMAQTALGPVATSARWACILDDTTGTVLLEKAADARMPPSSLTKMMTAYVVFTFLAAGRLHLDQSLYVSEKAWRMQGSKMFVPLNGSVLVSELIQGMLVQSGNDACIVLAEGIAGSEEHFADLMNEAAARLGLKNSHFMNPTGWPADNHYMSARDVAVLASRLIHDFPQYYHYFGEKDFTFSHIHQGNRNVLVDKNLADGLKTGHTDAGGFGLCASALRNGRRVIIALNGMPSSNERAREGERLLQWGVNGFEAVTFFQKGQIIEENAPVWMGVHKTVSLRATQDFRISLPVGWRAQTQMSVSYPSPLMAPVMRGQSCGEVILRLPSRPEQRIPLEVGETVDRLGFAGRILARFGHSPD